MAGVTLGAVAAFAAKVYGFIKGIYDFLNDDEPSVAELIEKAKEEILDTIVEVDHLEVKDLVGGYVDTFRALPHLNPGYWNLGDLISDGYTIMNRLETYLVEKQWEVGVDEAYVYTMAGKYAYHDAAPYNLVVLIQAAALKLADSAPTPVCALYRRAYAVNLELIGEPTSQQLPFASQSGYLTPTGVRAFMMSRLWQHLYDQTLQQWSAGPLTIGCEPCHHLYLTGTSYVPSVYAAGYTGGRYGLEGPAHPTEQTKCLNLSHAAFDKDPVVQHVAQANVRLLDLLGSCQVGVRESVTSQQGMRISVRKDVYGSESTARHLRAMCELRLSRLHV